MIQSSGQSLFAVKTIGFGSQNNSAYFFVILIVFSAFERFHNFFVIFLLNFLSRVAIVGERENADGGVLITRKTGKKQGILFNLF
jgi:hypothetical protein